MDIGHAPTYSPSSSVGPDENDFYGIYDESQLSSSPEIDHAADISSGADGERKSAFFDYKQEKTLRQTDAKLFFQQQQQAGGHSGWNSPNLRSTTWGPAGNLSKAGSVRSYTSSHHPQLGGASAAAAALKGPIAPATAALGLGSLDRPKEDSEVQGPGMSRFDPHGILESASQRAPSQLVAGGLPADVQGGYASRESRTSPGSARSL